jgi:hypothetical protein
MADNDKERRRLIARIGAHRSWAQTEDRSARTAPARKALLDRFDREVDPDGKLPLQERAKRAENARKAYYLQMSLKAADARRRRKAAAQHPDKGHGKP